MIVYFLNRFHSDWQWGKRTFLLLKQVYSWTLAQQVLNSPVLLWTHTEKNSPTSLSKTEMRGHIKVPVPFFFPAALPVWAVQGKKNKKKKSRFAALCTTRKFLRPDRTHTLFMQLPRVVGFVCAPPTYSHSWAHHSSFHSLSIIIPVYLVWKTWKSTAL